MRSRPLVAACLAAFAGLLACAGGTGAPKRDAATDRGGASGAGGESGAGGALVDAAAGGSAGVGIDATSPETATDGGEDALTVTVDAVTTGPFTEWTLPTTPAQPWGITLGPDGAVWFTELRAGRLGRVRDGRVTEFRLPRPSARPFGIAVDRANNVWYTDLGGWLGMLRADQARSR